MSGLVAFSLTEEFAGEQADGTPIYGGGQIARIDGTTFDVGAELEDGDGTIVLSDQDPVAEQLRALPCLRELEAPSAAEIAEDLAADEAPAPVNEEPSHAELKAEAAARGLSQAGSKADLLERITEHDEADAESATADQTSTPEGEAN